MQQPAQANDSGRLAELEGVVARGLQTFLEVGAALAEIRDRHLYKVTHATFEAYCRDRWKFTATRARQLIDASQLAEQVEIATRVAIPTERHARALAQFARQGGPEAAGQLLQELSKDGPSTAGAVREAVADQVRKPRAPQSPRVLGHPEKPVPVT